MKVICEICSETIGIALPSISFPMIGRMFGSFDTWHGYPPPFEPDVCWEFMMCPVCRHRPFIEQNRILTDEGYVEIKPIGDEVASDAGEDDAPKVDIPEVETVEDVEVINVSAPKADKLVREPNYSCPKCHKGFRFKGSLTEHMNTKHGESKK
jgi:hypothetical protein